MGWNCGFCALLGAGICSLIAHGIGDNSGEQSTSCYCSWFWLSLLCSAFWVSWQWEEGWQMPNVTKHQYHVNTYQYHDGSFRSLRRGHVYSYKTSWRFCDWQTCFLIIYVHPTCKEWRQGFQEHQTFISISFNKGAWGPLRPKDVLVFLYSVRGLCQTLDAHHLHAAIRKVVDAGNMVYGRSPIAAPKMAQRIAIVGERIPQVNT